MTESASQLAATQNATPLSACTALIDEADEDLRLSLRYAVSADRPRLAALFAFQIELRRIPASVSEPALGEIRLQWHREALHEIVAGQRPRAHPVILALAAARLTSSDAAILEMLIDARARLLYEKTFASLPDLRAFFAAAEAPLAVLALGAQDPRLSIAAQGMGEAHALARLAPGFAPAFAAEAAALALTLRAEHAPALGRIAPEAFGRIAYLALVRGHAARADGAAWPLAKRLALLAAAATGRF